MTSIQTPNHTPISMTDMRKRYVAIFFNTTKTGRPLLEKRNLIIIIIINIVMPRNIIIIPNNIRTFKFGYGVG